MQEIIRMVSDHPLMAVGAAFALMLILYFKATGGYKAVELSGGSSGGGH